MHLSCEWYQICLGRRSTRCGSHSNTSSTSVRTGLFYIALRFSPKSSLSGTTAVLILALHTRGNMKPWTAVQIAMPPDSTTMANHGGNFATSLYFPDCKGTFKIQEWSSGFLIDTHIHMTPTIFLTSSTPFTIRHFSRKQFLWTENHWTTLSFLTNMTSPFLSALMGTYFTTADAVVPRLLRFFFKTITSTQAFGLTCPCLFALELFLDQRAHVV